MSDMLASAAEERQMDIKEKLQSMKSAVDDIDRYILDAAFRGGFSQDRVNDIYHRISLIQKHMIDLER